MPEKSVLRRREGGDVESQYVTFSSVSYEVSPLLDAILSPPWLVGYAYKVSFPSLPLVLAALGPTVNFTSSTGGRVRLQRYKRLSTKFIGRLMPTNPLSLLRISSCQLVCTLGHSTMCAVMGVTLCADSCDINVSPDKRTILLHSENNLVEALKVHYLSVHQTSHNRAEICRWR